MTTLSPREYLQQIVVPALRLAGHEVHMRDGDWEAFIHVAHAGYQDSIKVWVDGSERRDYISLIRYDLSLARASRYRIRRGECNLPGILAAAKRLTEDMKSSLQAKAEYDRASAEEDAVRLQNLSVLQSLANQFSVVITCPSYDPTGWKADFGSLTLRCSETPGRVVIHVHDHRLGNADRAAAETMIRASAALEA